MHTQVEVLPEINMSNVAEQIQKWYTTQYEMIPPKIENAIKGSADEVQNKARERKITYLSVLNEIATSEKSFIDQTLLLQDKIKQLITKGTADYIKKESVRNKLKTYLEKVNALVVAQNNLNFFNCYKNENLNTVETQVYQHLRSTEFSNYITVIVNLATEYYDIASVVPDTAFTQKAVTSAQRIPRYKLLVDQLIKTKNKLEPDGKKQKLNSADDAELALQCIIEYVERVNNRVAYLQDIKRANAEIDGMTNNKLFSKPKQLDLQRFILREILDLKLNTKLQKGEHYHGYIQTLLARAYPELFEIKDNRFDINKKAKNYGDIYKALGYDLEQGIAPDIEIRIDLKKLNKDVLTHLYETRKDNSYVTGKNPLWLVLKSIKAIDEEFSAIDKIETYRDIALSCYNREISSGDEKYDVVLIMAQSAYSVAASYPKAVGVARHAFTPEPQYKGQTQEELIHAGRFGWWVVNKYPTNQALHQLLEAPHLDSHVDTVRKLNQKVRNSRF